MNRLPWFGKREREVWHLLLEHNGVISLNEIASAKPVLFHTFRNGISRIRTLLGRDNFDYKWIQKLHEYRVTRWPAPSADPLGTLHLVQGRLGI